MKLKRISLWISVLAPCLYAVIAELIALTGGAQSKYYGVQHGPDTLLYRFNHYTGFYFFVIGLSF